MVIRIVSTTLEAWLQIPLYVFSFLLFPYIKSMYFLKAYKILYFIDILFK